MSDDKWQPGAAPKWQAAADREAAAMIERIDGMLEEWSTTRNEPRYEWAAETLEGIKESVARTGRVSEGQQRAVDNIENARTRR